MAPDFTGHDQHANRHEKRQACAIRASWTSLRASRVQAAKSVNDPPKEKAVATGQLGLMNVSVGPLAQRRCDFRQVVECLAHQSLELRAILRAHLTSEDP